jgi:hypothetical protein
MNDINEIYELTGLHAEQLVVATQANAQVMDYKLDSKVIDHVSLHFYPADSLE